MQEVHNNWRQTQEAGRTVVLRSYFFPPFLPSAEAASTSPPEKLRRLLDGTRKAPGTGQGVINTSSEALT